MKTRVMFVCLGNICRSPLGHGLFLAQVAERGLSDQFDVASSGTSAYHAGEPPDPGSVRVARDVGVDISGQRSQHVTAADLEHYDYVVAMDRSNQRDLLRIDPTKAHKIHLMRSFQAAPDSLDVPDPWGGGIGGFQQVCDMVTEACEGLLEHILAVQGNDR